MTDQADLRILDILAENARESFADIAHKVGISPPAVRRRIEGMVRRGLIEKFTIERGDQKTSAIVLVSVDFGYDTAGIAEALVGLEGIQTVYEITGQYDIVTIIRAATISGINSSIDALRKTDGIRDTNTVIILRRVV